MPVNLSSQCWLHGRHSLLATCSRTPSSLVHCCAGKISSAWSSSIATTPFQSFFWCSGVNSAATRGPRVALSRFRRGITDAVDPCPATAAPAPPPPCSSSSSPSHFVSSPPHEQNIEWLGIFVQHNLADGTYKAYTFICDY